MNSKPTRHNGSQCPNFCCFGVQVKTRVKLEGEELERYLEAEKEKEKNRQVTESADRRYVHNLFT